MGGWALEDGGDTARTAWWTETGGRGGVEVEGRERARPNEGEMCQSSLLPLHSTASPARSSHMDQLAVRLHPSQPFDIRLEAVPIPT